MHRTRRPLSTLSLLLVLVVAACSDDKPQVLEPPVPSTLTADSAAVMVFNGLEITMDREGKLWEGRARSHDLYGLFLSGLWLGGTVAGEPHANVAWVGGAKFSNYTSRIGDEWIGVYHVSQAHLQNEENVWPIAHGFPVDGQGDPTVFGDEMLWSALRSDSTAGDVSPALGSPLPGFLGSVAVYGESDHEEVLFLRWDFTNTSDQDWIDVYCGLYSDTDLGWPDVFSGRNQTGYLAEDGVTYTYIGDSYPTDVPQFVTGLAFLPSSALRGQPHPWVTSHRIMRKNSNLDPDFGEIGVERPDQLLWALEGRSNSNQPMIDPTTGEETLFAFTGDPVTGEGWIDTPMDVRSMITGGPFSVPAGESATVIGVWGLAHGDNLAAARDALVQKISLARVVEGARP